jgi:two-component system sensor histidine kinase/response regulator
LIAEVKSNRTLKELWELLIGNSQEVPFQTRIFHAFCLCMNLGALSNFFFSLLAGMEIISLWMVPLIAALSGIYYFSRVKKHTEICIILFEITKLVILVVNFYYNSGIDGPSLLLFLFSLFITVTYVPKNQLLIWVSLNVISIIGLLAYEYYHPEWILNTYAHEKIRYFDFVYTYFFGVSLMLLVFSYIRNAYKTEHDLAVKRTEDLSASNNKKDKLLSIIAHDLKDPLASIQLYLELLTEYNVHGPKKIEIEKKLLERTKNTSETLATLLLWVKNQMDGISIKLDSISPKMTLESTLKFLGSLALEKGITLRNELNEGNYITADKDMLQLVVRNLIMNAIKFTNAGGLIIVSSTCTENNYILAISDTGVGIDKQRAQYIFTLQSQSTYGTRNEKGVGLGLILCKEFTELQGASISFTSKPNEGTTFFLKFLLSPQN